MSTAIYVRSARPGPMELARQREQCEDYAREHGLIVTRVYADTGHARDGLSGLRPPEWCIGSSVIVSLNAATVTV